MNGVSRNITALSIETTGQVPSMTKGQKALLQLIRDCVDKKRPLDFGMIVRVYYDNVRKTFSRGVGWCYERDSQGNPKYGSGRYSEYVTFDIWMCWIKQEKLYDFKPQIRQWFVANIGILVVKNQLVIIPTINLDEE